MSQREDVAIFERVLRELRSQGSELRSLGVAELGETAGAAFVAWPDGRESVLTLTTMPLARALQTGEVLLLARERGLPVPCFELVREVELGGVAVVQEHLPGRHPGVVDPNLIDVIMAANDRFADLLGGYPEVPSASLNVGREWPSTWREPLAAYSGRSRHLLRRIEQMAPPKSDPGNDLVHPDLTVSNLLIDHDMTITGIIDWNDGALRGDRHYAMVKLLFDLTWEAAAPSGGRHHVQRDALAHLTELLQQTLEADVLRTYWAHWTATMLYWTIRSSDDATIDLHLKLGEQGLLQ